MFTGSTCACSLPPESQHRTPSSGFSVLIKKILNPFKRKWSRILHVLMFNKFSLMSVAFVCVHLCVCVWGRTDRSVECLYTEAFSG